MRTRSRRHALLILPILLFLTASTGTILASDACSVSLVQALTNVTRNVDQRVTPAHRHTQETLARWEEWGNLYLATHGHPYVPPKRKLVVSNPSTPGQRESQFKFECEVPPIDTPDLTLVAELTPEGLLPVDGEMDVIPQSPVALVLPPVPGPGSGFPGYPYSPVLFGPGGNVDQPFVGLTPEPSSFVLLGTAAVLFFVFRRSLMERLRTS